MVERMSWSRLCFVVANYAFLAIAAVCCLLPLVYILAVSLSSSAAASAGQVSLWPVDFSTASYRFIIEKPEFFRSFWVSVERVALGVAVNTLLTVLIAYPLSKDNSALRGRTFLAWFFVFTMLFSGGLIPLYMTIRELHLIDSIWALVLHHSVPIFNVVVLINFFRALPKELEEAAFIDGGGHLKVLWTIFLPLSMPSLATLTLFSIVGQWNSWFDGILFMNSPAHYPMQSYLYTVVNSVNTLLANGTDLTVMATISDQTAKAAQIFLGALPVLVIYPFLQRYFVHGMVMGSVKE